MFYDLRGSNAPVVYIHGGFPSLAMFFQADHGGVWEWELDFADRFSFLMYSRRGCWLSSRPSTGYELHNQARDLVELLNHLRIDRVHVIASSAGGPIAIMFASMYRERTRSLILAGTGAELFPSEDPISRIIRSQVKILEEEGPGAAYDQRPKGVQVSVDELWERDEMKERGTLDEYEDKINHLAAEASALSSEERIAWHAIELKSMSAYLDANVAQRCAEIASPTLVVHGERDCMVPVEWGRNLAFLIPKAELCVYSEESHSLIIRSAAVRREVMQFISDNG